MENHSPKYKRRPPRIGQVFQSIQNPLYFVTMLTQDRSRILANDHVHAAFRTHALKQVYIGVSVGHYVILPDHIHLFIRIGNDQRLGESIKHLKQSITKVLRYNNPDLKVWQPGFFDHLLRNSESYSEKWRYVSENPIRAGFCSETGEWLYQGMISYIDRV